MKKYRDMWINAHRKMDKQIRYMATWINRLDGYKVTWVHDAPMNIYNEIRTCAHMQHLIGF